MDAIQSANIKVPNSVLVSGMSDNEVDEEVIDFLKQYGAIERVVKIDSTDADFQNTAVVEFKSGETMQALESVLPYHKASSNPNIIHHVQPLSSIYATNATRSYLSELQDVAKLSSTDFAKVLREELARIEQNRPDQLDEVVVHPTPSSTPQKNRIVPATAPTPTPSSSLYVNTVTLPAPLDPTPITRGARSSLQLAPSDISTPEVQRMVIEHIVKSGDVSTHHSRLRPFSGKTPCPSLEVDYDTWRSNVDFYFNDTTVPDKQVVRKIVESLLPPAVNVVKHLGPQSSPREYLRVLDSAYGTVDDADELFATFLTTDAEQGEKASVYLHRLQSILSKVVKRNGIAASDADRQLLKQFCRGCFNNNLITHLQLSQLQKDTPPSFSELLLLVRTEEDKQAAKSRRMKQQVGFQKAKVQSNTVNVYDTDDTDMAAAAGKDNPNEETKKLQKQLTQLQAQLATLTASLGENSTKAAAKGAKPKKFKAKEPEPKSEDTPPRQGVRKGNKKPRPWYCFTCGEDGHIAPSCPNEPNPEVVEAKRKELKEKQRMWEEQNQTESN